MLKMDHATWNFHLMHEEANSSVSNALNRLSRFGDKPQENILCSRILWYFCRIKRGLLSYLFTVFGISVRCDCVCSENSILVFSSVTLFSLFLLGK